MTIPVPQRRENKKLEDFYPLQKEELMALRKVKLINNAAYVHLALRYENPYCDRPIEVIPKEFALRWQIPEVSVYKAIAKLKELGILNIKSGKLVIDWVIKPSGESELNSEAYEQVDSAPFNQSSNLAAGEVTELESEAKATEVEDTTTVDELSDPRKNYQIGKKIIRSDNRLSNPKKNYQIRENRGLKPLSSKASDSPQIIQTYSDFIKTLSESERDDFFDFVKEATRNLTKPINDIEAWLANKTTAGQNRWEVYYTNFKEFKQLNSPKRVEKPHRQNALAKWQAELEERRKQAEQNWEQEQNNA